MKYLIIFILCVIRQAHGPPDGKWFPWPMPCAPPGESYTRATDPVSTESLCAVRVEDKAGQAFGLPNESTKALHVNGRVTVDDRKDEVSNLILDVKPVTTEKSIVKEEDERNNTNDNLINTILILDVKPVTTETTIVTNEDERNNTNDNLINANLILDVKADANEASIVTNKDERNNNGDNLIIVNLPVVPEPTEIVKSQDVQTNVSGDFINATFTKDSTTTTEEKKCITEKEIFNNLLNPNYNVSYIMKNLCKSTSKSFKSDTGKALLLTDYIKKGKIKEGRTASKVDSNLFLGIKSYSGFFTVNETYNSNIFFWYFPVLSLNVSESPWIIWLQGGPGASSMTGLFDEIGPFTVANNSLKLNPYTWLQNHSLLFIDNPVGTGYSFTEHEAGYVTDMTGYTNHLYSTLVQFLQVFPELRAVPLYIAGESYAGKYVPAMGMEIYRRNQTKENPDINLKGMIIGNAYVDPDMISHLVWPFYYFGLLDKQQVEIVRPLLESFQENIKANKSIEAKEKWNSLITVVLFMTHQRHAYNFLDDEVPMGRYIGFLKSPKIKKAIHVGDIKFSFVNMTVNSKLAPDFLSTTKPLFETLLEHYKVLAYCGQLDQMLPCVFLSENYRTWKWNGTDEFIRATRIPYMYNNKLAGYLKSGGRFTEVVVRGAGHMVPLDKPAPAQNLVTRWTHDKALSVRFSLLQTSFVQEYVRNNSMTIYL